MMKQYIASIMKRHNYRIQAKNKLLLGAVLLLLISFFLFPWYSFGKENTVGKTLIIYYSRTGKTKLVCETLQKHLNADLLEIKDPKDRSGSWGFITSSIDAFLHKHTPIEPEHPDLSAYSFIIVASPIWSWNLSTPIHTLFEKNRFDGKKLILITTANIHIMKYEHYGEDASFIKRFLRDYLREKRAAAASEVKNAGGEFVGHYHFETKGNTDAQLTKDTLSIVGDIQKKILK